MIMDAKQFIENKAKSEWGLRLILEGISESQKPVLYRLIELYAQEKVKNCSIPVEPKGKFYCKKGTCTEEEQCNHCWNEEHPFNQVMQ